MGLLPEKMLRVRIIGSNMKKESIISSLHDAGVIQLEAVSQDITQLMGQPRPGELYKTVNRYLQIYRGYETILPPVQVSGVRTFGSLDELFSEAASIDIEEELKSLKSMESDTLAEMKEIDSRLEVVASLTGLDYDLSIFNGSTIASFIARGIDMESGRNEVLSRIPDSTVFNLPNGAVVITIPAKKDAELARIAAEFRFSISHIPVMTGKPAAYKASLESKLAEKKKDIENIHAELREISKEHYEKIAQIREQLEIENRKMEVSEKLSSTQDSFVMEGWIPKKHYRSLVSLVEKAAGNSVIINTIETKEDPPTMLSNPKSLQPFEFFIRFYSLPKEYEIDPTTIFSLIFPFFFGIMVGDWGFGLVILAVALWMRKKLTTPGAKTILPKGLTKFALTVFGRNALLVLAKALIPASMVAIVVGLLFNGFFGFPLLPVTVFEVVPGFTSTLFAGFPQQPTVLFHYSEMIPKLLLFTGYIGLAMVTFGLVLGLINEIRLKHRKRAVSKIGWLLLAWGIALFGLNLIHKGPISPYPLAAAVVGIGMIAVSEGALGLIEIPSIISHILSYTRILGIMLAAVYLSYVLDLIFLKLAPKSPLFAVVGAIILVFGQLFTLGIAVLEPGIQGARLLYVEFFSKFYYGNGKIFSPFGTKRRYTTPEYVLDQEK